jgi:phospholipid/cholesterol/gamma-HCH transport system substrate-binding protein
VKENFVGASWRLAIFVVVCLLGTFGLFAVFGQLRFDPAHVYRAEFSNVSGLHVGDFVRVAGVEVGKVSGISFDPANNLVVDFNADDSTVLTDGTRAVIRYSDLIGGRYLALEEGVGGVAKLAPGGIIPQIRTAPALNLDALIGGFRPLFRALDPDQVNSLSGQLITALQGQGNSISSFLVQTAALTNNLADRDDLIGEVIANLNTVLGALGDQSKQLDQAVGAVSELINGLAARKVDITNAVAYANEASGTIADLLSQARPPLQNMIQQTDRSAGTVMADADYVDELLRTLPDSYRVLSREGLYGDYFNFYVCDLMLKTNGKGGQPVYVKVAGQPTGRCAPR